MTPNYSILSRHELLYVAKALYGQVEELQREVERLRSVKAAMEANIEEKWNVIQSNAIGGGRVKTLES